MLRMGIAAFGEGPAGVDLKNLQNRLPNLPVGVASPDLRHAAETVFVKVISFFCHGHAGRVGRSTGGGSRPGRSRSAGAESPFGIGSPSAMRRRDLGDRQLACRRAPGSMSSSDTEGRARRHHGQRRRPAERAAAGISGRTGGRAGMVNDQLLLESLFVACRSIEPFAAHDIFVRLVETFDGHPDAAAFQANHVADLESLRQFEFIFMQL